MDELRVGVCNVRVCSEDSHGPLNCLPGEEGDEKCDPLPISGVPGGLELEH